MVPISADPALLSQTGTRLRSTGHVDDLISLYRFDEWSAVHTAIHLLKYQEVTSLGFELGKRLGSAIAARYADTSIDVIAPVPLHKVKQRERGYNQSEYICKGVAVTFRARVHTDVLERVRYTRSQTTLDRGERRENVAGAFAVDHASAIRGASILLVDDVITTGATTVECASVLRSNGAERVLVCSVALAP